ncbi:hypothetical protein CLOM_g20633 [Closterium sp. NIES-68]|nr:hypothetical protein CLOM_g20633 [Closterium sp. NIES-68]GJP66881.1 hypothetical protein CLOP_g23763 [Closterium sp. NIES-67]
MAIRESRRSVGIALLITIAVNLITALAPFAAAAKNIPQASDVVIQSSQVTVLRQLAKQWGSGFDGFKTWTASGAPKKCSAYVGVGCDSSGQIVSITLAESGAEGAITGISKLTALTKMLGMYWHAISSVILL